MENWVRVEWVSLLDGRNSSLDLEFRRTAQFLACPKQLSEAKLSNGPRQRLKRSSDPSLREGFRQRARAFPFDMLRVRLTLAKRFNLLKKFIASTLTVLWKKRARLLGKPQAGRVHG
jgi:hypothetical protein